MIWLMPLRLALSCLAALTLNLSTSSHPQSVPPAWPITLQPLTSPAAADSAQPQLSVSARGTILSWVERSGAQATLKFAERTRNRTAWTDARTVAAGTDWFVNWADVPSVIRLADGSLAAHWLQRSGPDTYAYDVRLSYSKDDGKTWSPSFTPHHDGTKTEHGFASLFQMPGAGLGLVWLDGRAMAGTTAGSSGHGHGDMSVRFAAYDRGWKQIADEVVDPRVCECCPTSAVVTPEGVLAAFRNRGAPGPENEVRDIYVTRRQDGKWSEPTPVHNDGWKIPACPVNGPMLSARGRDVAIAWFTATNDQPHAYVAFSSDAGRSFSTPIRIDETSSLGRVDVELLPDGSAAVAYIEFAEQRAQFQVRRIERSGVKSVPVTVSAIDNGRASGYPRIALDGDQLVFAWTERVGPLRVQTAVAELPQRRLSFGLAVRASLGEGRH